MNIPVAPPDYDRLLSDTFGDSIPSQEVIAVLLGQGPLVLGKYRHWDRLRHLTPPEGLTHEQWWLGIRLARRKIQREIPLRDKAGRPFVYGMPDPVQSALHEITQQASGRVGTREQVTNPNTRHRYVISSLIDEAITSSQIEGASTTTQVAKEMLRSGRRPRDRSEQMILNNFEAMEFVQEFTTDRLTPDLLLRLHKIVMRDAMDEPGKSGVLRGRGDNIVVTDPTDMKVLHVPPSWEELPNRLYQLCSFANGDTDDGFVHPVIRAIILHFWLAYDHPFVDGNGRTARALFYWSMLNQGYWMAEFISISSILKRAPAQYARSYLFTETDGNDLTYFLVYQLKVVCRAIRALMQFLDQKQEEIRDVEALIRGSGDFNHRQLAMLGHAIRHPGARYTFDSHKRSHGVVYQTARTDLLALAALGLLRESRVGRMYQFEAPSDLAQRLRQLQD